MSTKYEAQVAEAYSLHCYCACGYGYDDGSRAQFTGRNRREAHASARQLGWTGTLQDKPRCPRCSKKGPRT